MYQIRVMESKALVFLIVGVLIGAGVGYGILSSISSPKIDDYMELLANNNVEISSLISELDTLEGEHILLQNNYDELSSEADLLRIEHSTLTSQYEELELNYLDLLQKYEIAVASLPLSAAPLSAETIDLDYTWYYNGRKCTVSLSIPESMYQYYSEKKRAETEDYSIYVTHPYDDEYINTIIQKMNFIALDRGYSEIEKINLIISFVQSLPYTSDNVTTPYDEYPRYPLETLVDNGGDCEDTSILTASLLKSMNYELILINPPGHMAVGVNVDTYGSYWTVDEKQYYYLETTSVGWEIGDIPDDYNGVSAYLYELTPIPICTQNWTASWKGTSQIEISITVTNEGTAMASDIRVYASFDAGEEYVWNEEESPPFSLNIGNSYSVTLVLDVPRNENTRLIIGIVDVDGYSMDESYSNWFDT